MIIGWEIMAKRASSIRIMIFVASIIKKIITYESKDLPFERLITELTTTNTSTIINIQHHHHHHHHYYSLTHSLTHSPITHTLLITS